MITLLLNHLNAFNELHEEYVTPARLVAQQKSAITFLEHRNKMVLNELDQYKLKFDLHSECMKCDNCPILESKIDELTKIVDDPGSFHVFSVFLLVFLCILESNSCSVHAFSCICLVLVFGLVFLVF